MTGCIKDGVLSFGLIEDKISYEHSAWYVQY